MNFETFPLNSEPNQDINNYTSSSYSFTDFPVSEFRVTSCKSLRFIVIDKYTCIYKKKWKY